MVAGRVERPNDQISAGLSRCVGGELLAPVDVCLPGPCGPGVEGECGCCR